MPKRTIFAPGVALSEAQMARLTTDIVWLVEREVTQADGTTAKVRVPQIYARVFSGIKRDTLGPRATDTRPPECFKIALSAPRA